MSEMKEILTQLTHMNGRLEAIDTDDLEQHTKHDMHRFDALERTILKGRWWLIGASAVITFIVTLLKLL